MEAQALGELRPDIKKVFFLNLVKVALIIGILAGSIYFVKYTIKIQDTLDDIKLGFQELGMQLSPPSESEVIRWLIISVSVVSLVLLLANYIMLGKVRYVFYRDRLSLYKSFLMVSIKEQTIPYGSIAKVSYEGSALNTGTVILEISGMNQKEVRLEYIDNADQAVANIQRIIENYRAEYYAQYAQDKRLGNIVSQLG